LINPKVDQQLPGFTGAFCCIPSMAVLENIHLFFLELKPKVKVFILMSEPSEVTKLKKRGGEVLC